MIEGFQDCLIDVAGAGMKRTSLRIENGRISAIGKGEGIHLPENLFVIPGLIDEHIHGSDGFDAMDGKKEAIEAIQHALPQDGVTSFCPTTMTMGKETILKALASIDAAMKEDDGTGTRILGAHLEGPFISPLFKGAQEEKNIRSCDVNLMKEFAAACLIREVTFAYEEKGGDLLRYLKENGITASIGHSNCAPDLLKEGIQNGIACSTHTYNAMRRFSHRDVGIVGVVLLDGRVRCELIADLIHVCPDAIRLLYRLKGNAGVILITDSMEAKHLPEGKYALGGQDVFVKEGAARLEDGTLAGSILTLNSAVRNLKNILGISLEEAVACATKNPAKNLHLDQEIGAIKKGCKADFAVVDQDLNVYLTVREGQIIYQNPSSSWRF
jgi:N-acetylglucosamine-6-phosphate deacetylase